jgi:tripeptidyl-peptidase-1
LLLNSTTCRYGQHLTKEEVEAFHAPHPDSAEVVDSWLQSHGIDPASTSKSAAGDWITLRISVAQAEKMLNTKYNVYHHPASGEEAVRTMSYSLPKALQSAVDLVSPTTYFGTLRSMKATSFLQPNVKPITPEELVNDAAALFAPGVNAAVPSTCARTITPACLRALYNTSTYTPTQQAKNKLGVVGYLEEFANTADLQVRNRLLSSRSRTSPDIRSISLDFLQDLPH